ncbi:UDP-N-acetylmuramoyl-tripeptide--D-alanyl-D-alanine ligase [Mycolicibacterium insubricum]|uniref:UDP-N-acetylmuramoyl-tripeptide--D-alanyl-D-alanine ligase n=1 Tax=Mycolicibacterium insubricum TaxID=444597 RepID=A0A1X0DJP6_9MYCO|nr:UDP-N-acetylmuramoyl-tripeptide--D-alanyl-D-alanine ligase [Mycolicibacterium insubricum]MCB9441340.1 UDP-N-acetylmuramoyl-tripeptide--D-alanyl-D-alanine ligase [Mycolicibacterium sp.]ORA72379.1 UDP-N-acetylmuramoyl-tripeptide--D-alanyl-D-alanine ligase [Mycolicibacterium insubricum]BBZ67682.1 UDP-N-acetylmuramoyl-tripeptide--D-alanyl-D-alanine ligase [Mycolicibacterium insubricum]
MIELTVAEIAEIVGGTLSDIDPVTAAATRVTGTVEFDSRAVTAGGLFLALPGARVDGHDHAAPAIAAGAVAVLAARPVGVPAVIAAPVTGESRSGALEHDRESAGAAVLAALALLAAEVARRLAGRGLRIIGVTGSSGKTSTKDLLAAVLAPLGSVVAPPGSFNNELGHPWTVLRATTDTDFLVLELSARHPGNIAALADIARPDIGVVLNVGTAHLGEFGSRQAIAETKGELAAAVPPGGAVVLNVDDPAVAAMAERAVARVVRVSRSARADADLWASDVVLDELARPRFTLRRADAPPVEVTLAVHGDHQVSNALCAAAVAFECGATGEQLATALAAAGPASARRMQVSTRSDGVTVINDAYNANPDSMAAGLKALAWMARQPDAGTPGGRRAVAVLGEMGELGDDAITEHDRIGRLAVRLDVARLIVVGKGRSMGAMFNGAVMEGSWGSEAVGVDDADTALELLRSELRPGDVVLVKASNAAGLGALAEALVADPDTGFGDGMGEDDRK